MQLASSCGIPGRSVARCLHRGPTIGLCAMLLVGCHVLVGAAAEPSDVIGKWKIRIDGGGEIYTAYATVKLDANTLTGSYETEGRRRRLESVELSGDILTLVVNTQRFSRPVVATFSGDLNGDSISGEVDMDSGSRSRSYDFTATRISKPSSATTSQPAAQVSGPGSPPPPPMRSSQQPTQGTVSFRFGVEGYEKTVDTEIWAIAPSKSLLRQGTMTTDGNNGGGESQVLLRFGDILGDRSGQIPRDARIVSATLTVVAFDPGTTCYLHRLLIPWTPAVTWDGVANGVSVDNIEASKVRDGFTFGEINMDKQLVEFNVSSTVQRWADGDQNYGWVFVNTGGNGWDFYSSDWIEVEHRPMLEVTYEQRSIEEPAQ